MKQVNLKSDRLAALLEEVTSYTGESKVDAVAKALEVRLKELRAKDQTERVLVWLEASVWASLPPEYLGKAPSKEEQEDILGF